MVNVLPPKAIGHENFDGLANKFFLCVPKHVLYLRICHDDSSFTVCKDDRIRCGLHDSPKLLLGLLQSRQIIKDRIKAMNFPSFFSAGNKVNLDISPPCLLAGEVTLKAGALA